MPPESPINVPKKSRKKFKNQIEEFFNMSFSEFVSKYFEEGMTRKRCCSLIEELTDGKISPKQSTVWNYIKNGIKNKEISDFDFHGRKHRKQAPEKAYVKPLVKKTQIINPQKELVTVTFSCKCGESHEEQKEIKEDFTTLLLLSHKCPHCGERGCCCAEFAYADSLVKKEIVPDDDGICCESFVDEKGEIILNPLIDYDISEGKDQTVEIS